MSTIHQPLEKSSGFYFDLPYVPLGGEKEGKRSKGIVKACEVISSLAAVLSPALTMTEVERIMSAAYRGRRQADIGLPTLTREIDAIECFKACSVRVFCTLLAFVF